MHLSHLCLAYDRGCVVTFSTLPPVREMEGAIVTIQDSFVLAVVWGGSGHDSDKALRGASLVSIATGKP